MVFNYIIVFKLNGLIIRFFFCRGFAEGLPQQPAQHVRSGQRLQSLHDAKMVVYVVSKIMSHMWDNVGDYGVGTHSLSAETVGTTMHG